MESVLFHFAEIVLKASEQSSENIGISSMSRKTALAEHSINLELDARAIEDLFRRPFGNLERETRNAISNACAGKLSQATCKIYRLVDPEDNSLGFYKGFFTESSHHDSQPYEVATTRLSILT